MHRDGSRWTGPRDQPVCPATVSAEAGKKPGPAPAGAKGKPSEPEEMEGAEAEPEGAGKPGGELHAIATKHGWKQHTETTKIFGTEMYELPGHPEAGKLRIGDQAWGHDPAKGKPGGWSLGKTGMRAAKLEEHL